MLEKWLPHDFTNTNIGKYLKQSFSNCISRYLNARVSNPWPTCSPQGPSLQPFKQLWKFSLCLLMLIVKKYHYDYRSNSLIFCVQKIQSPSFLLVIFVGYVWLRSQGLRGKGCLAVWYLTPYFRYFILPPRWLVSVMPCPRKSQKNYTKEKTATDNRQRHFFYTFLYLLGSTTIPWMREFFLNTLKWLNPLVKVTKMR